MTKTEIVNSILLLKKLLDKTFETDKIGKIWGLNSNAVDIINSILKREGLL